MQHPPNDAAEPAAGSETSRRQVVVLGAVTALAGGLAACSDGSAVQSGAPARPGASASIAGSTSEPPGAGGASSSAASASAASASGATSKAGSSAEQGPSQDALVKLSTVPIGGSVKIGGTIVTRTGTNKVIGHDTTCTHAGCTVMPAGRTLNCPCHGSKYDPVTGAVLAGPAPSPLGRVALVVKGGYVHLA